MATESVLQASISERSKMSLSKVNRLKIKKFIGYDVFRQAFLNQEGNILRVLSGRCPSQDGPGGWQRKMG